MSAPRGRFLVDLVDEALEHGDLFHTCRKTVAVVTPDGSVKRQPTIRVQIAIFERFYGFEITNARDRWMTEKLDAAIAAWRRHREARDPAPAEDGGSHRSETETSDD